MLKEQELYIQILSDFLNHKETIIEDSFDYEKLLDYSSLQNTNGILYYQIKKYLPKELQTRVNSDYLNEIYSYTNRTYLYNLLTNKLKEENINFYSVKGLGIAKFYPVPSLRTMGDCDIIVDSKDRPLVDKIFRELGFDFVDKYDEWIYAKNNIQFELHDNLLYEESNPTKEELAFIGSVNDYVKDYELDINFHFIYLLLHLKKHLLGHGIGFRQFMDLKVVIENNDLDMNFINSKLNDLNLLNFKETCLSLVNKLFVLNIETKNIDDDFIELTTSKIFDGGVFGYGGEENMINNTALKLTKKDKTFVRFKEFLLRFFPPYEIIKTEKDLTFFSNKPILLPLAWIVRFYYSIKRGSYISSLKDAFNNIFVSNKQVKDLKSYLNKWGL